MTDTKIDKFVIFSNLKIQKYTEMLNSTYKSCALYKEKRIHTTNDFAISMNKIEKIYTQITNVETMIKQYQQQQKQKQKQDDIQDDIQEDILKNLQEINNSLFLLFKAHGTYSIEDVLGVCFGNDYIKNTIYNENTIIPNTTEHYKDNKDNKHNKYNLLKEHFHPISFKILSLIPPSSLKSSSHPTSSHPTSSPASTTSSPPSCDSSSAPTSASPSPPTTTRKLTKDKTDIVLKYDDRTLCQKSKTLDAYDMNSTNGDALIDKVYGVKVIFHKTQEQKALILYGIFDDVILNYINNDYVKTKLRKIIEDRPQDIKFHSPSFNVFYSILNLKDIYVYSENELYQKYLGYMNQIELMKQKPLSMIIRDFLNCDMYGKRTILIQLLLNENDIENKYISYLLYDLLSTEDKKNMDTLEQQHLYDTLPQPIKKIFKKAMQTTVQYTKKLSNFDTSKIPLEQQICLMKVSDSVKEKAIVKLKEIKAKSEDSGSKARQYLDGLLKIPFGIYRKEEILCCVKECNLLFTSLIREITGQNNTVLSNIPQNKSTFSILEIMKYLHYLREFIETQTEKEIIEHAYTHLAKGKRETYIEHIGKLNDILRNYKQHIKKRGDISKEEKHALTKGTQRLIYSGKKAQFMREEIERFIKTYIHHPFIHNALYKEFHIQPLKSVELRKHSLNTIHTKLEETQKTMTNVRSVLDKAVHGHTRAKRQLERIIGQWMTGELNGYCLGFEGSPGLGKTTLAKKGLAKCLKDENGEPRPFGFIALGGSSNGSTLEGHNYTYVGSTWGRIVDILIESKCMNPIIFIDELDKVSKTEHGKEIIGILTHLVDPTQNDTFQDKYFSGIDIDLSKALFIFSYNDVSLIDKILLDRIHRIQFENLTVDEKITIVYEYVLPEIYEKIGFNKDVLVLERDVIEFIITHYTYEAGVRKLKEILFEILSEMNLECLKNEIDEPGQMEIPIHLTREKIETKYLKDRTPVKHKVIHRASQVGVINGLWANAMGQGGIIPIEAYYYPTATFLDLKLTGMQGDVMKESMNVAKTLAYSLTENSVKEGFLQKMESTKMQGLHIHCPEGAVPKDGPSAGTAITVVLYSLLNNLKIKNTIAITGEINLQGCVTAIGGLELKILGGIRAGVTEIIYPKENEDDFRKFMEKYEEKEDLHIDTIVFHRVETIQEVFSYVFENE